MDSREREFIRAESPIQMNSGTMAKASVENLFERYPDLKTKPVDLIIVASSTPARYLPSMAVISNHNFILVRGWSLI